VLKDRCQVAGVGYVLGGSYFIHFPAAGFFRFTNFPTKSSAKPASGTCSAAFRPADICLTHSGHYSGPDYPENMQIIFIEQQVNILLY
jgi:hypothetical protein